MEDIHKMNVLVYDNDEKIGIAAGNYMCGQVLAKPDSVLGLATGSTPLKPYGHMIELYKKGAVDFSRVTTFNLDEYCNLDVNDKNSYHTFMYNNLFNHINISSENINFLDGNAEDLEKECKEYEKKIKRAGGIDIQLLGLGHDGHIGFNEPNSFFDKNTHCVDLTEMTIEANKRFFASADEVPRQAYTMGIGTIMRARKLLMIVSGKDKAEIAAEAFLGEVRPEVPASIIQFHPDVTIIGDAEALSKIN